MQDEAWVRAAYGLEAADDGGDGFVQVEQVQDPTGSTGWVVTALAVSLISWMISRRAVR